jgi:predicted DCC family thiol-disulfide oxidoreductase YuxK
MNKTNTPPSCLTVLYDGSCPLCRREVGVYQGLQPSEPIAWKDVSAANAELPGHGQRQTYMARFHVQQADGTVLSGAAAFVALWATLPGWRWLAKLASLPGVTAVMEWVYCRFLVVRPWLQKAAVALEKPKTGH